MIKLQAITRASDTRVVVIGVRVIVKVRVRVGIRVWIGCRDCRARADDEFVSVYANYIGVMTPQTYMLWVHGIAFAFRNPNPYLPVQPLQM